MNQVDHIKYLVNCGYLVLGKEIKIEENVVFIKFAGINGIIRIGDNCVLRSGCTIYGGCRFGNNVMIGHNTVIMEKTVISDNTYIGGLVNCEGNSKIGSNCGINAQSHITKFTEIGNYVFLGPMVCTVNDWDMRYKREGHGKNLAGPKIKDGVRIGAMATILPNIELGKNCIVGAGSTVTKNVIENEIVFGSPAEHKGTVPIADRLCLIKS